MESSNRGKQLVMLLVIFGAVVFGMVLAGSLGITPEGATATAPQRPSVTVAGGAPDFAALAEAVLPAVVSVQASTIETFDPRSHPDPFEFFFGPRERGDQRREFRSEGAGSGFVVSNDGWIVTNNHVIEGATEVTVRLGEREYDAEVKGRDESTDLALLKIDAGNELEYLALGDSDEVRVGEWVMAIGNPLALASTVTVGVVSAKGRRGLGLTDSSFENFIQTDAAINRGNSGGPLVNTDGEVIGISTAMNFGAENIGFAVPVNTLRQILPQLQEEGRVRRGYLGVNIANLDFEEAESFGLDSTDGALVLDVLEETPAADAGLEPGDIILQVDDHHIVETRDLIDYVSARPPGSTVRLLIFRNGERETVRVKLRERGSPGQVAELPEEQEPDEMEWLGLQYQELTRSIRSELEIPREFDGVVVRDLAASSPLYEEGVRRGHVIVQVNGQGVDSTEAFEEIIRGVESGGLLRFYVIEFDGRGGRRPFFAIVRVP